MSYQFILLVGTCQKKNFEQLDIDLFSCMIWEPYRPSLSTVNKCLDRTQKIGVSSLELLKPLSFREGC